MVPLKYLSNFLRTLEMVLIKCKINLFLTWYAKGIIVTETVHNQIPIFTTTDTKIYVLVVTLSAQDNGKLLQQ